ncbi:MAG: peptidoglycan-binding protein, partial [Pseudomonadota bacterium]
MALVRRSGARFEANIWPGFVDAMTALLLILMFVLSIFMIVQFTLSETVSGQSREIERQNETIAEKAEQLDAQETEIGRLAGQISQLSDALSLERDARSAVEQELGTVRATLAEEQSA